MKLKTALLLALMCAQAFAQGTVKAPGATPPDNAVQVGGTDGTTFRAVKTDSSGNVSTVSAGSGATADKVQGATASGVADAGNPVKTGCIFETSPTTVTTGQDANVHCDSSGKQIVVGGVSTAAASVNALPGMPIICDSANSGTVTQGQAQMVRCRTDGSLTVGTGSLALADGNGNSVSTPATPGNTQIVYEVAPIVFNGSTWDRQFYCANKAKLNALAAATTQIVALSGATKIRVCGMVISNNNATATTLKMVEGTGASCVTGQTDVTALMNIGATSTAPISIQWGPGAAITTTTGGDALCFTSSAASSLEIEIMYAQF